MIHKVFQLPTRIKGIIANSWFVSETHASTDTDMYMYIICIFITYIYISYIWFISWHPTFPTQSDPARQSYPEHEDFQVMLALGDPQCSPVWTVGAAQDDGTGVGLLDHNLDFHQIKVPVGCQRSSRWKSASL